MHHSDMHPSLRRFRESFEVLAQPAAPTQPRKRPFNDPSSWQHLEVMAIPRTPDDCQDIAPQGLGPINQPSSVTSISPNQSQTREPSH